ncbi:tetratricopeptide repeat-containing sulfotransferase family protein [Spiribacter insolitus]|uniref:Sulfotransferase n=1 Tax=Spiribacter insolitus TaxID=3122417 RepID=A0ABV3T639_9GAMM
MDGPDRISGPEALRAARKRVEGLLDAGLANDAEAEVERLRAQFGQCFDVDRLDARVLTTLGRWQKSRQPIERALAVAPDDPLLLSLKTRVMDKLGEREASDRVFRRLLDQHPDHWRTRRLLFERERDDGNQAAAIGTLRSLLEEKPRSPGLLYEYSRLERPDESSPFFGRLERMSKDPRLSVNGQALSAFALGNLHLACGHDREAFLAYRRANTLLFSRRVSKGQHPAKTLRTWQKAGLSRRYYATRADYGLSDSRLAFIFGPSRSGKSLVEALLARHPQVGNLGESFMTRYAMNEQLGGRDRVEYLASVERSRAQADAWGYLARRSLMDDKRYWLDTMPTNLGLLPVLGLWYPDMPVILCTRDLLDVGVTIYFRYYSTGNRAYFDLNEIGRYIAKYTVCCKFMEVVLPNPVLWVRYEDLVHDPYAEARRIGQFLGLDMDVIGRELASPEETAYRHPIDSHNRPSRITTEGVGLHERFKENIDPLWNGIMENLGD